MLYFFFWLSLCPSFLFNLFNLSLTGPKPLDFYFYWFFTGQHRLSLALLSGFWFFPLNRWVLCVLEMPDSDIRSTYCRDRSILIPWLGDAGLWSACWPSMHGKGANEGSIKERNALDRAMTRSLKYCRARWSSWHEGFRNMRLTPIVNPQRQHPLYSVRTPYSVLPKECPYIMEITLLRIPDLGGLPFNYCFELRLDAQFWVPLGYVLEKSPPNSGDDFLPVCKFAGLQVLMEHSDPSTFSWSALSMTHLCLVLVSLDFVGRDFILPPPYSLSWSLLQISMENTRHQ